MNFTEILQHKHKTIEDAQLIYDRIRDLRPFDNFCNQNLRAMDFEEILELCQTFEYERIPKGNHVFRKGDVADKFYIILSGYVSIINPKKKKPPQSVKHLPTQPESPVAASNDLLPARMKTFTRGFTIHCENWERSSQMEHNNSDIINQFSRSKADTMLLKHAKSMKEINEQFLDISGEEEQGYEDSIRISLEEIDDIRPEKKREHVYDDLFPRYKISELDQKLGKYVFNLKQGEGFGELALKGNNVRSADVVCRTHSEFLVIGKRGFDLLKMRKEREKEDFLKEVFPFLSVETLSPADFNKILGSFQIEAYMKGQYVTLEGKATVSEPKLFVVFRGDCLVEKNVLADGLSPKAQANTVSTPPVQIARVGKGMLVGEEILATKDEYYYSVKVLSETAIVYSVASKVLESPGFRRIHYNLLKTYERKKQQRELIFGSAKREQEGRIRPHKDFLVSNGKVVEVKHMAKSTVQAINRQTNRDQSLQSPLEINKRPVVETLRPTSSSPDSNIITSKIFETSPVTKDFLNPQLKPSKEKVRGIKIHEDEEPKRFNLESKIDFLKKMPDMPRAYITITNKREIENLKLFARKKSSSYKRQRSPIQIRSLDATMHDNVTYTSHIRSPIDLGDVVKKDIEKGSRRFKLYNQALFDIKSSIQKPEELDRTPKVLIPGLAECSPSFPKKISLDTSLSFHQKVASLKPQRVTSMMNSFSSSPTTPFNRYPLQYKDDETSVKKVGSMFEMTPTAGKNISFPEIPVNQMDFVVSEKRSGTRSGYERAVHSRSSSHVINRMMDIGVNTASMEFGECERSNIGTRSPMGQTMYSITGGMGDTVTPSSSHMFVQTPSQRLHGSKGAKSLVFNQLSNARDWRSKVFRKTPKVEQAKLSFGKMVLVNALNSKARKND